MHCDEAIMAVFPQDVYSIIVDILKKYDGQKNTSELRRKLQSEIGVNTGMEPLLSNMEDSTCPEILFSIGSKGCNIVIPNSEYLNVEEVLSHWYNRFFVKEWKDRRSNIELSLKDQKIIETLREIKRLESDLNNFLKTYSVNLKDYEVDWIKKRL